MRGLTAGTPSAFAPSLFLSYPALLKDLRRGIGAECVLFYAQVRQTLCRFDINGASVNVERPGFATVCGFGLQFPSYPGHQDSGSCGLRKQLSPALLRKRRTLFREFQGGFLHTKLHCFLPVPPKLGAFKQALCHIYCRKFAFNFVTLGETNLLKVSTSSALLLLESDGNSCFSKEMILC